MTVLNQIDRYDLAMDVIDRVPRLQAVSGHARDRLKDKLIEHRRFVRTHGEDMPEIREWSWGAGPGPVVATEQAPMNTPEA
jgi:xylulose-5-phosphate/fructose-6-phosphate phosphoketolase